jgi:shikimate dehydrogenase
MIDAGTRLVGLIGWPVEHSVSPAMHNAAFAALGLNWGYVPLPVLPELVAVALQELRAQGFQGANVTAPHKQTVMAYLDEVTEVARAIGAANTLLLRDGKLIGHNTDADGFRLALAHAGVEPAGGRAVVVGCGGGGRAVAYGLLKAGAAQIVVLGRNLGRAEALAEALSEVADASQRLRAVPLTSDSLVQWARSADLLVNATPLGMAPDQGSSIWPEDRPLPAHVTVVDLVYNPPETRLMRQARESGARAIGGLEMLVRQGALSFELWTGEPARLDVMRSAARAALERQVRGSDVALSDGG